MAFLKYSLAIEFPELDSQAKCGKQIEKINNKNYCEFDSCYSINRQQKNSLANFLVFLAVVAHEFIKPTDFERISIVRNSDGC